MAGLIGTRSVEDSHVPGIPAAAMSARNGKPPFRAVYQDRVSRCRSGRPGLADQRTAPEPPNITLRVSHVSAAYDWYDQAVTPRISLPGNALFRSESIAFKVLIGVSVEDAMPEGLSPGEVGKEISEHRAHVQKEEKERPAEATGRDRVMTIIEAVLLAVVAVLAAWSGFASAKWGTESSLDLAKASAARTEANRAAYQAADLKNFDALTFNAWFTAYVAGNKTAMLVAERRFRPQFLVAFNAWLATHPFTNPHAPPGPTYMPQYAQPELAQANQLDARADNYYSLGETAGSNSDGYVRTTVYLASVLFLVGISGHFRVRAARTGLVALGGIILVFCVVLLILSPRPPL